jgi:hypothetical protein
MVFFLVDRLQTFVDWDSLKGLIVLCEVSIILVVSTMGRDDGLRGRLEPKHRLCNLLNIVNRPLTIQGDLDVSGARIIGLDVAVEAQSRPNRHQRLSPRRIDLLEEHETHDFDVV